MRWLAQAGKWAISGIVALVLVLLLISGSAFLAVISLIATLAVIVVTLAGGIKLWWDSSDQ